MIESEVYIKFKRKIYLAVIPMLLASALSYSIFFPYSNLFIMVIFPLVSVLLLMIWILIYRYLYIRVLEMVCLAILTIYHLSRFVLLPNLPQHAAFDLYVLWSPLFFMYIFIVLERKKALTYALFIYMFTIILGLPDLRHTESMVGRPMGGRRIYRFGNKSIQARGGGVSGTAKKNYR